MQGHAREPGGGPIGEWCSGPIDTENPALACPGDAVVECSCAIDPGNTGTATATDALGIASLTYTDDSIPDCGNTEVITRTWTAVDGSGNTSSCKQTITVVDTAPPQFSGCPNDIEQRTDAGVCSAVVDWVEPTATDACGIAQLSSTNTPLDVFAQGTTTVTYTAIDCNGHTTTFGFEVTVHDVEPPTTVFLLTPANPDNNPTPPFAWLGTDNNGCTAPPALVYSTCLDSGMWTEWTTETEAIIGPLSEGWHTFRVRAKDEAGNVESTATYTWFVDLTAPRIEILVPQDQAEYLLNLLVNASWNVEDLESGLADVTYTTANGEPIDTSTPGLHPFFVESTDVAGNRTRVDVEYRVVYKLTSASAGGGGFEGNYSNMLYLPDDRSGGGGSVDTTPDGSMVFKSGDSIGIHFLLRDDEGQIIPDAVASVTVVAVTPTNDGEAYDIRGVYVLPFVPDPDLENPEMPDGWIYDIRIPTVDDDGRVVIEPGIYDLWIGLDDGTEIKLRIEVAAG